MEQWWRGGDWPPHFIFGGPILYGYGPFYIQFLAPPEALNGILAVLKIVRIQCRTFFFGGKLKLCVVALARIICTQFLSL